MGRRERMRSITRDEIKNHARRQMAEGGTAALSLTGIAKAMDLSTPALYYYFRSREELITALIIDAYNDLADSIEQAVVQRPVGAFRERLLAAMLQYRSWALEHRIDFLLIYGDPIPGYEAPLADTASAAQRTFAVFLAELQTAAAAGQLVPKQHLVERAPLVRPFPFDERQRTIDPAIAMAAFSSWIKIHGAVVLEIVGQLPLLIGDTANFYLGECHDLLDDLGVLPPDSG
jgi:AcrR family transcriptional regulator